MGGMQDLLAVRLVCRHWFGPTPVVTTPLTGSGFSGAPVYLVVPGPFERGGGSIGPAAPPERFVLKAFKRGWSRSRATAVHRLLERLRNAGIDQVPRPAGLAGAPGETIAAGADGRQWEMLSFQPGEPVEAPTAGQSIAALETLASVHAAAAGIEGSFPAAPSADVPPAVARRLEAIGRIRAEPWSRRGVDGEGTWQEALAERRRAAARILDRHGGDRPLARLAARSIPRVPLRLVLRDVWRAHLLFDRGRLTGLIDFHAAGIDTPATDLARLLGSWTSGQPTWGRGGLTEVWRGSLEAYGAICPLSAAERGLIDFLHLGGVLGGLDHWFRTPIAPECDEVLAGKILNRVDELLKNLDSALEWADGGVGGAD